MSPTVNDTERDVRPGVARAGRTHAVQGRSRKGARPEDGILDSHREVSLIGAVRGVQGVGGPNVPYSVGCTRCSATPLS